ncbi:Kef-type K+ transport system membrane component KefB [Kitasatospora sp. MAA19]|uniref:cation:proton antiporter n=1 Tax=Kitasatospora sp. MAA19 TaxID=3035090 RepID=UPI0024763C94|nr:cation:proton antiporter [Kitasatospora sp. MAA19]MDH6709339.1 Kef-type K+ transport system membrane component KefB [Kitasatospora sp. MAA19]
MSVQVIPRLLLALPVVILACRVGAALLRRLGQPPVVGEIVTGILLGPSLLGRLWPHAQSYLFPSGVTDHIEVLGQLGLLAFMFLIGLELDLGHLRGNGRAAAVISQASILLPLLLGGLLALAMFDSFAPQGTDQVAFVLFVAVAMSITAFPVLARILTDQGLYHTPIGSLAMACAAVSDIIAWCLLALVVAFVKGGAPAESLTTVAMVAAYFAVMMRVVRPLLARLSRWKQATSGGEGQDASVLALLFCGTCLSALLTDALGVHALFGAFLFGVVTPRRSAVVERSAARLRSVAVPLLLPLFFVTTGLRTDIGMLAADPVQWLWLGAVLAVALVGKWGGGSVSARLSGRPWREALSLGALMNCRGLTELIVLNIGLDLGVIDKALFTILVLMALITTAVTSPVVRALGRREEARERKVEPMHTPDSVQP